MTEQRYRLLMKDEDQKLTPDEIKFGWHFCCEFDGLLIGPGMSEMDFCSCLGQKESE